ncbi:MAG: T9SS type A sorting domain-containing protein [Bacteroidetes bacterium]|nr:T9SS type A sorting domain-containing protein [Bacteroidota bacterium]
MKKTIKIIILFITYLLIGIESGQAQTMTGSVTQPCNNNGAISVTVTGLTLPINYTYYGPNQTVVHTAINSTTDVLTGLGAYQFSGPNNTWYVVASSNTTAIQTFTLTNPFTIAVSQTAAICPALGTVQATFAGGTSPFSCTWANMTNFLNYQSNPAVVSNGPYQLTVTDGANCVVTLDSIGVYSNSNVTGSITTTPANCTNGTAIVSPGGGTAPYTYLWSNAAVTQTITGLSQGYYSCTITDALGCQNVYSNYGYVLQTVTLNINTTPNNPTCLQNNGSIISFVNGGTAPYTYLWSNGATTQSVTGLTGNQQYNVMITDASGCTGIDYTYLSSTTPISVTYSTTSSSCTAPTGGATITPIGGAAPYTIVWNTFPVALTGPSISGMASGMYWFNVTDVNGCVQTGSAFIPPVSTINAYVNNNAILCPLTTGSLSASVSGSNPPFTYAWNTAATSSAITSATLGGYSCVITDAVGCSVTKYGSVFQVSPINVGFNVTQASCIYNSDGSVTAVPVGGASPYTYSWSNAQTSAIANGLNTGYYYVTVTDANGCTNNVNNTQVFVGYNAANNSCYCTITGTVYVDANNNCNHDPGENGVPNIQMHCSGLGYVYTNPNGVYSFMAPTGTYTLSETIQQIYPLAACQTNNQLVSVTASANCSTTVNFANNIIVLHDLKIITSDINMPVPGNMYTQKVIVQNNGSVVENTVQLGYVHDGQLGFSNCTPWVLAQPNAGPYPNWYEITSGFPSLNPGASTVAFINYNVPTNIPLNTLVNFYDTVSYISPVSTSWLSDNTPWDNLNNHQTAVVGSFDPNFKEVSPQGTGPQGYILAKDSILTYVIHFQNTGTYFAQNIVLVDSLDPDLNLTSLHPGYSDHNYTTTMKENGVVKYTFSNINLPWQSAYGDMLSSGMVSYSVKLKPNLALGTQIKNKAAIYFDYNAPVITNTTFNTLTAPLSVKEINKDVANSTLFPNPTNSFFTLTLKSTKAASGILRIIDISGRELISRNVDLVPGENNLTETTNLQSGIYFVQLKTTDLQIEKKLIIAK